MSDAVSWAIELRVRPEHLGRFRELTEAMVAATRLESGAVIYERFIGSDQSTVHLYERYVDSDAAVRHLDEFAVRFSDEFVRLVERQSVSVYGRVSPALRVEMDGIGARYFEPLSGFAH